MPREPFSACRTGAHPVNGSEDSGRGHSVLNPLAAKASASRSHRITDSWPRVPKALLSKPLSVPLLLASVDEIQS